MSDCASHGQIQKGRQPGSQSRCVWVDIAAVAELVSCQNAKCNNVMAKLYIFQIHEPTPFRERGRERVRKGGIQGTRKKSSNIPPPPPTATPPATMTEVPAR